MSAGKAAVWAVAVAESGVAWQGRKGADCPWCKARLRVHNTKGGVRYCRCDNTACLIHRLGLGVKAVP